MIAQRIRKSRTLLSWSQRELAQKLGVSRRLVSRWENSRSVPSIEMLIRLSVTLGVSTDYLLRLEVARWKCPANEDTESAP